MQREARLWSRQFGFRSKRSTEDALFIVRRRVAQALASRGGRAFILALDWRKAFDSISPERLLHALARFGLNQSMLAAVGEIYASRSFTVVDAGIESTSRPQKAGISQGCPLSPYLFTLVMTCIDLDIKKEVSFNVTTNRIPGIDFDMVYYADDTIVFSKKAYALRELLKLVEITSAKYGLRLNKDKCVVINMNNDENIWFEHGDELAQVKEAMYLGNELNDKADIKTEILHRKQEVRNTRFKLSKYWKAKNANTKLQIIIYDAIIRSKLLYGLETIQLTQSMKKSWTLSN